MKRFLIILVILFVVLLIPVNAITNYDIYEHENLNIYESYNDSYLSNNTEFTCFYRVPYFLVGLIALVFTLVIMFAIVSKYKKVKLSNNANSYINDNHTEITKRKDMFIRTRTIRLKKNSKRNIRGI